VDIRTSLQQGMSQHKLEGYELKEDGILMYKRKVYVTNVQELKNLLSSEMHKVPYARNPSYQKTLVVVKNKFYWHGMKNEVVVYIAKCMECQKVKAEHIHPAGLLQLIPIPEWKWEVVTMDFITKLHRTAKQHDFIMVVVDKLTKATHFIPVKSVHKSANIVDIYMRENSKLHGVPKTILSDEDSKFTSNFWKGIFREFGTNMNFSTTYHR
jgi:hypothetical protein